MAKFYLWMSQKGGGCDYTIGCGQKLYELKGAETIEQARALVPDVLLDYGIDDGERALEDALIVTSIETAMPFVERQVEDRRLAKSMVERERKRAELERLKRELGEK